MSKVDTGHAPINQFVHYRAFPDASNRTVVGFNVDTLYSLAQLDLSKEPMVLSVPDMGNRFWVMQIIDAWNNVPHAPGSRTVGSKGGHFAIVGPTWKGTLPQGLTELRVPTNLALVGWAHVYRRSRRLRRRPCAARPVQVGAPFVMGQAVHAAG